MAQINLNSIVYYYFYSLFTAYAVFIDSIYCATFMYMEMNWSDLEDAHIWNRDE